MTHGHQSSTEESHWLAFTFIGAVTSVAGCIAPTMVIHYKRNNSLGIGMPMYNKGCDCWRLLSYLCLTTVPPPYKPSTRACQDPPPLVLRLFHTPLGYLNTNSKVISRADPISFYGLLAGLYTVATGAIPAFPLISKTKTPWRVGVQELLCK